MRTGAPRPRRALLAFEPARFGHDGFIDMAPSARLLDRADVALQQVVAQRPDVVAFRVLTASDQRSIPATIDRAEPRTTRRALAGGRVR